MAAEYGALGLLLGVLVKDDLEGFFLIIMGSLMDTFLQNPLGNPLANRPVLEYFPSFGPTQFASASPRRRRSVAGPRPRHGLGGRPLGVALMVFRIRTRVRPARAASRCQQLASDTGPAT